MATEAEVKRLAKFIGRHANKIDAKGRVFLPARMKPVVYARWGNKPDLMLAVMGFEHCLVLVERAEWFERLAVLEGRDWLDCDAAQLRRLSSLAEECSVDNQDRISLPQALKEFAGLEDEVLFVGCGDYIELWNPARGAENLERLLAVAPELIGRVRNEIRAESKKGGLEQQ